MTDTRQALLRPSPLRGFTARLATDRRGGVAIIVAFSMVALAGFAALAVEVSMWYMQRRTLQGVADTAALSGAMAVKTNGGFACTDAPAVAAQNGYGSGMQNISTTAGTTSARVNCYNVTSATTTTPQVVINNPPATGSQSTNVDAVEVIITRKQPLLLTGLLGLSGPQTVIARAVAAPTGASDFCSGALSTTASPAVTISNNATVGSATCGTFSNSAHQPSISVQNGGTTVAGPISIAGTGTLVNSNGATSSSETGSITYGSTTADPFASDTSRTGFGTNPYTSSSTQATSNATPSPGYYPNGLCLGTINNSITKNETNACPNGSYPTTLTLSQGTYYISNLNTGTSNTTINATSGTTIIITGQINASGNTTINIVSPTKAQNSTYYGIAMMAPSTNTNAVSFGNNININIDGALYFPGAALSMSSNVSNNYNCTQVIADTLNFSNNAQMSDGACPATFTGGGGSIALVE